jgi:hypothetical protein
MISTAEKQRAYLTEYQNANTPCPSCGSSVNINAVLDAGSQCTDCATPLRYCLGFTGNQWLETK